jgi:ribosomal protein L29
MFRGMRFEIARQFGRIGAIGQKSLTANGTRIFAGPHAFPVPWNHHRAQTDFLFPHEKSLQRLRANAERENLSVLRAVAQSVGSEKPGPIRQSRRSGARLNVLRDQTEQKTARPRALDFALRHA